MHKRAHARHGGKPQPAASRSSTRAWARARSSLRAPNRRQAPAEADRHIVQTHVCQRRRRLRRSAARAAPVHAIPGRAPDSLRPAEHGRRGRNIPIERRSEPAEIRPASPRRRGFTARSSHGLGTSASPAHRLLEACAATTGAANRDHGSLSAPVPGRRHIRTEMCARRSRGELPAACRARRGCIKTARTRRG